MTARGPDPRRLRRWAVLAAVAWTAGLFALSSMPLGDGSLDFWWRFEHDDKLFHAAVYAVLGGLWRRASGRVAPAVLAGGLTGIVDEWVVQAHVPGRHPDPFDLLADVGGAALGAWAVSAIARWRRGRAIE